MAEGAGVTIRFMKLNASAVAPEYQTQQAAGADLCACLSEPLTIRPGEYIMVPTGIAVELPEGHEMQVRPRSGLAAKHGITVLNAPGTIDSDYRGEIKVVLINHGTIPFVVQHGDRIAQAVIAKYETVHFGATESLEETERGADGFGSTGVGNDQL